jgi:hypothetical protein
MDYKIIFMSNYEELVILNDNIDVKIALSTERVYAVTLYTISNINKLIENSSPQYFVSSDMIILKDLSYSTINKVIIDIIKNDLMHLCMSNVGTINQIFPGANSLADIKNYGTPVTGFYQ